MVSGKFHPRAEMRKVAIVKRGKVGSAVKMIGKNADSLKWQIADVEPLLLPGSSKKPSATQLKQAESVAKAFIKARSELIRRHRVQVETSTVAGMTPLKPYGHELHESYVKATGLLKRIEQYRERTRS